MLVYRKHERYHSMKMTVFWDIETCSLEVDWHFRGAYCLHHQVLVMKVVHLWNGLQRDYMVLYHRRLSSSYSCHENLRSCTIVCLVQHILFSGLDTMMSEFEERTNTKFCVQLCKTFSETYHRIRNNYGDKATDWAIVCKYLVISGARRPCNGCKRRLHLQIK
jgi:hypothetical protein